MEGQQLFVRFCEVDAPWLENFEKLSLRVSVSNQTYSVAFESTAEMHFPALLSENRIHLLLQAGNIALGSTTMTFEKMFGPSLDSDMNDWTRFEVPGEVARFVVKQDIGKQTIQIRIFVSLHRKPEEVVTPQTPLQSPQSEEIQIHEQNEDFLEEESKKELVSELEISEEYSEREDTQQKQSPEYQVEEFFVQEEKPRQESPVENLEYLQSEEQAVEASPIKLTPLEESKEVFESPEDSPPVQEPTDILLNLEYSSELPPPQISRPEPIPISTKTETSKCNYIEKLLTVEFLHKTDSATIEYLREEMGPSFEKILDQATRYQRRSPRSRSPTSKMTSAIASPHHTSVNVSIYSSVPQELLLETPSEQNVYLEAIGAKTQSTLAAAVLALGVKKAATNVQIQSSAHARGIKETQIEGASTLRASMKETEFQAFAESEKVQQIMFEYSEAVIKVQELLKAQANKNTTLTTERDRYKKRFSEIQSKRPVDEYNFLKLEEIELKKSLEEVEGERKSLEESLKLLYKDTASFVKQTGQAYTQLLDSKEKVQKQLRSEELKLESATSENIRLKTYLMKLKAGTLIEEERQSRLGSLQSDWNSTASKLKALKNDIINVRSFKEDLWSRTRSFFSKLEYDTDANRQFEKDTQKAIEVNRHNTAKLKHDIDSLEKYNKQLLDIYNSKRNSKAAYISAKKRDAHNVYIGDITVNELKYLTDVLLNSSQNHMTVDRVYKLLKIVITERDEELSIIRGVLENLKKENPIYFPDENDPVDVALADTLNARNEMLELPFIKIRKGQYTYGTRKVILQLERGKLTVKVGGGYISVEDFIKTYTDIELDKMGHKPQVSPHARKLLGKWAETIMKGGDSPAKEMRENLLEACQDHKYSVAFAVKDHRRR